MTSISATQDKVHDAVEVYDCGHHTKHSCLNTNKRHKKPEDCTYRVPVKEHAVGVRRLCPTCTHALATKERSNPGAVDKWWDEGLYAQYMSREPAPEESSPEVPDPEESAEVKSTLKRSNAVKKYPGLFGRKSTGLRNLAPAPEKETPKDEANDAEAKKPSRVASFKSSVKRILSGKKR